MTIKLTKESIGKEYRVYSADIGDRKLTYEGVATIRGKIRNYWVVSMSDWHYEEQNDFNCSVEPSTIAEHIRFNDDGTGVMTKITGIILYDVVLKELKNDN